MLTVSCHGFILNPQNEYNPMSLVAQTTYAELLDRAQSHAFAQAFAEPGTFTSKTVNGRRYWYFQTRGKNRVQRYVGPESDDLLARIRAHRDRSDDERGRRELVSALVRSFGMPRALPQAGAVVAALARAGVFRLRSVLIGTVAFQTYPAMLGTRLPASALQTGDVDIAQFQEISIAVDDQVPPMLELLKQVDASFRPIPHSHEGRKSVAYGARDGLRVDFLTPNRGADTDAPQRLPALQTDAQPLRFLDFLIHRSVQAVLLHEAGVPVRVPAPERFAIHKLILSQRRPAGSGKSAKDLVQAQALIEALAKNQYELAEAWNEAYARGKSWRELLVDGASALPTVPRDRLLKAIGWKRAQLPALSLSFPRPLPRYDFDRKDVVFTAEDAGGEVTCIVSGEAMRDDFGLKGSDPAAYVEAVRERQSQFEDMARAQYLSTDIEEPGAVLLRSGDASKLRAKSY